MLYRKIEREFRQDKLCCLTFQMNYQTQNQRQASMLTQNINSTMKKVSMKNVKSRISKNNIIKGHQHQPGHFQIMKSSQGENNKKSAFRLNKNQVSICPANQLLEAKDRVLNNFKTIRLNNFRNSQSSIKITYSSKNIESCQKVHQQKTTKFECSSRISPKIAMNKFANERLDEYSSQKFGLGKEPTLLSSNKASFMFFKKNDLSRDNTRSRLSSSNMRQGQRKSSQIQHFGHAFQLGDSKKSKRMSKSHLIIQNPVHKQIKELGYINVHISNARLQSSFLLSDQNQDSQTSLRITEGPSNNKIKSAVSQQQDFSPFNMRKFTRAPHVSLYNNVKQIFQSIVNEQSAKTSVLSSEFTKRKSQCVDIAHALFYPSAVNTLEIQ